MEPDQERLDLLMQIFSRGFIAHSGIEAVKAAPGEFESRVDIDSRHAQQDGLAHAGLIATMADHTAGYAGFSLAPPEAHILSIEFKVNFLRTAPGPRLVCRAKILKPGRRIMVAESEVYNQDGGRERLCAKATVTLMVIPPQEMPSAKALGSQPQLQTP